MHRVNNNSHNNNSNNNNNLISISPYSRNLRGA